MRPIRITMQAFGSYGKKTQIDFTKTIQNLFLISGDTGAGKTTIFDAMVFALYGEASSENNKKDGKELQSDYVPRDVDPYVELEFSEMTGGENRTYIVRRSPQHDRPKLKGTGTTSVKSEVSLTMPDGSIYPSKETNDKIREIVGLTKEQFMQVGMIAQGEFMNLLRAKSDDKKEIFRKLFDTELYNDIVNELDSRRKKKQGEMARIRTMCQTEVGHIDVSGITEEAMDDDSDEIRENAQRLSDLKYSITHADTLSVTDMEELTQRLRAHVDYLEEKKSFFREKSKESSKKRDDSIIAYNAAKDLLLSYDQKEKAEKELAAYAAEASEINEKKQLIRRITDAYLISESYKRLEDAVKSLENDKKTLLQNIRELPGAQALCKEANDKLNRARQDYDKANGEMNGVKEKVSKALRNFDSMDEKTSMIKKAEGDCKNAENNEKKAASALEELEENEKKWRQQSEKFADAPARAEKIRGEINAIQSIADEYDRLIQLREKIAKQDKDYKVKGQKYEEIRNSYDQIKIKYDHKERIFYDSQAGMLAKEKLVEGEPCPVCGSREHPHPCVLPADSEILTRDQLIELKNQVDDVNKMMADASEKANAVKEKLSAAMDNEKEARDIFESNYRKMCPGYDADEENAEDTALLLAKTQKEKDAELETAEQACAELEMFKKNLNQVEEQKEKLKKDSLRASEEAGKARTQLASLKAELESLKSSTEYESREAADNELAEHTAIKEDKEKLWKEADASYRSAKSKEDEYTANIKTLEKVIPEKEKVKARLKTDYENKCHEYEMSEAEWKETVQHYQRQEADKYRQTIDEFQRKKAAAEGALKAAIDAIGDRKKPDVEALRQANETADNEYKENDKKRETAESLYRTNHDVINKLTPNMEERDRIMREHGRLDHVYNALAGKVKNARMDLETYVQRYYLERILDAANERFTDMSAGQFELRIESMERAGVGKNRGLDLMVYSNVTGKEREITTLSGGESFMAALALALGMADTIQENSAAINLDVMFIDEGFGSLDDHSREQAVKVLKQMAGGSKLIGIISHVSELKQEIEDQLLVYKDENGSRVEWQIS